MKDFTMCALVVGAMAMGVQRVPMIALPKENGKLLLHMFKLRITKLNMFKLQLLSLGSG